MKCYKITNKGLVRKENQDAIFASEKKIGKLENLFIVCDGVGSYKGSKIASSLAIKSFINSLKEKQIVKMMDARCKHIFQTAISRASLDVYNKASNPKYKNMCTTLVCTTIYNNKLYAANVGDSRLYLMSERIDTDNEGHKVSNRVINKVTQDNAEIVETKIIPDTFVDSINEKIKNCLNENGIDKEQLVKKRRYLTKAVGAKSDVIADYYEVDLAPKLEQGKKLKVLLCSDGLYDMVSDSQILDICFNESLKGSKKVNELVKVACDNGGRDNISAILIEL